MPLFGTRGAASVTGFGGLAKLGYLLRNSLRFRASNSAYLSRTGTTATNAKVATYSFWMKRGILSTGTQWLFTGGGSGAVSLIGFNAGADTLSVFNSDTSAEGNITTAVFRDPAAWYHVVIRINTTEGSAADRAKIYVNGVQQAVSVNNSGIGLDSSWNFNTAQTLNIGRYTGASGYSDVYLAEVYFIDGIRDVSAFAKTDPATGQWIPIKYAGTYGNNGFYLKFDDSSAVGKDSSGNGNNWSTSGHSVTLGATYDLMTDVPTLTSATAANYATLNPLDSLGGTFSNGNLEYTGTYTSGGVSINGHGCRSTLKIPSSGKWYAEAASINLAGSGNSCMLGFTSSTQAITAGAFAGTLTPWIGIDASVFNGNLRFSTLGASASLSTSTTLFATYASGDIVNLAIDFSAGKFWVGKNGNYYNSGNPAAGTNETSTFTAGSLDWAFWAEYVASGGNENRSGVVANFGQRPFAHTSPSGFKNLNTFNLP
jgi:hypothetical protein